MTTSTITTPQTLTGTEGNDTLNGGPAADSIAALGGNDRIEAFEGNDTIDAGAGDDNFIDAGPGNDLVRTGSGNDWVILGGAFDGGSDTLDGGDGYDTVRYEYNRNGFNGSIQFTGTVSTGIQIDPQGGTDVISNVEELQVNAGSGNDLIIGDPVSRNNIWAEDGNDTIQGGASNDWLQGWSGADSIMGLGGNDYIQANANGNDANDTIDGGDGYDTISYNWWGWSTAVNFTSAYKPGTSSYTQADPGGGTDTISNIERVDIQGGRGNDTITGDAGDNDIRGHQGADTLTGGGGNDRFSYDLNPNYTDNGSTVDLNQAADLITDFGQGDSIQIFNWNPSSLLASGSSSTLLAGQALVLSGSNGEVVLHVGADSVAGSDFSVRLKGAGNTSLNASQLYLRNYGKSVELIYGLGPQTLTGTAGIDNLNGGDGSDSLDGGAGSDNLDGGAGDDTLTGGDGSDRFNFSSYYGGLI
ncbi:MAG: hypothetical protein EBV92_10815, partial [Betaproteobacteria bacterium]|nr:hypothetical protein [Betaproteobacteria bacterium]